MCQSPDCQRGRLPYRYYVAVVAVAAALASIAYAWKAEAAAPQNTSYDSQLTLGFGSTCQAFGQSFTWTDGDEFKGITFKLRNASTEGFSGSDGFDLRVSTATSTPASAGDYSRSFTAAESNALLTPDGGFMDVEFDLSSSVSVASGTKMWAWIKPRLTGSPTQTIQAKYSFNSVYDGGTALTTSNADCSQAWDSSGSDSYFITHSQPGGPDLTLSATTTEGTISFGGTFDPGSHYMTSLRVDITGPNLSTWSYAFNPPSPYGIYDSSTVQAAVDAVYPPGFYIIVAYACSTGGCTTASDSLLVDTPSIFDLDTGYITPVGTPISGFTGITDVASSILAANGNLIITPDTCSSLTDSASSIKMTLLCQSQRFQGIPPLSWVFGIVSSFSSAYHQTEGAAASESYATSDSTILSSSSTPRVRLAIHANNIWGHELNIDFLDSASSQPAIVARVKEIFPNYYVVLQLLLWVWFALSVGRKAQEVISNNAVIHQQEDQYRQAYGGSNGNV